MLSRDTTRHNLVKRLRNSLAWRIPLLKDTFYSVCARQAIRLRWLAKRSRKPHGLSQKLVVSLTSYPPRYDTLIFSLQCLLTQSIKPDHLILWVAHSDFDALPSNVRSLERLGLEIRKTEDLKSYKKVIPALDAFPEAFICIADDDVYYKTKWLEELVNGITEARAVTCHRANKIWLDKNGQCQPYVEWPLSEPTTKPSIQLLPTGVGGVLYPPGLLKHTREDREIIKELCPYADDIWLYWIGRRNGASYRVVGTGYQVINWNGSQQLALWKENVFQQGNDRQILAMIQKFGCPWL